MILLICERIPDGVDKKRLAEAVRTHLPHRENSDYIARILERKNHESACESLFALDVLCRAMERLPSPPSLSELILKCGEDGKPYFVDSNIRFNLSHSKGHVVCALSDCEEVGVDIEATTVAPERAVKLAKRYFSESEYLSVLHAPNTFSKAWSEKEAQAKYLGKSVAFLLSQKNQKTDSELLHNTRVHRFSINSIPISLCTKRDYSTIIFQTRP